MRDEDSRISQLVEEALNSGSSAEDVCADVPELLAEVRDRIDQCRSVEAEIDLLFPPSIVSDGPEDVTGLAAARREERLPEIAGYEVESIIGRGGMGVVYRARHLSLNRPVAIKMLLAGAYAAPEEIARFARESRAVAGLQNEHILRVYDVGDLDGRPYFTMEFVDGQSLAQRLTSGPPMPANDVAALLATVARAVQVAHDSGVVHRDLKPANILLTAEGSPKIVDFGLARRVADDAAVTLTGARVGTPSYMSPEQALGKAGATGPLVDVYALGAVLYEMLTGRPPFTSGSAVETHRKLISEPPDHPSRVNAGVPRDLATICLKCLEKDPQRRYPTPTALADDLDRFRRGEPVAARPARFPERVAKWTRRHPSEAALILGSAAAALLLVTAILWLGFQRAAISRGIDDDLREVARQEAANDLAGARTALEGARARLAIGGSSAPAALRDRVQRAAADLDLVSRLSATLLGRAVVPNGRFNVTDNTTRAERGYEAAFRESGLLKIDDDPAAAAARIAASDVRVPLLAALDDWAFCATDDARREWLFAVSCLADDDPTGRRNAVRNLAAWRDKESFREIPELALQSGASVQLLVSVSARLQELGEESDVTYLTRVQQLHPGDFWANHALAEALRMRHSPEAIRYFQAAIAALPSAAVTYNNVGLCLVEHGRYDEAADYFRMALRVDPLFAFAHDNLGIRLHAKGDFQGAIEHYRAALHSQPDVSATHNNLGLSLVRIGRPVEAMDEYRQAVRIDPNSAGAHNNLGILLREAGRPREAAEEFAVAVRASPDFAPPHNNLGIALRELGRPDEAIPHFQEAVRIEGDSADNHNNLGLALRDGGRPADALAEFTRALALKPGFAAAHANAGVALSTLGRVDEAIDQYTSALAADDNDAGSHENLAFALVVKGRSTDALAHFRRAVQLKRDNGPFHRSLGRALLAAGKSAEAASEFREAIRIDAKDDESRELLEKALSVPAKKDS